MERSQKGSKVGALFSSAQNVLFSHGRDKTQKENDKLFNNMNERQRTFSMQQHNVNFRSNQQQPDTSLQPDPMSMIHLRGPRPQNLKKRTLQDLDQYEPSRRLPSPIYKSDFHFDQQKDEAQTKQFFGVSDVKQPGQAKLDQQYSMFGGLFKSEKANMLGNMAESDGGSTADNQTQATKGDEDHILMMELYKTSLQNQRNRAEQRQPLNVEELEDELQEDEALRVINEVQQKEKEKRELEGGIESLQLQIEDQHRLEELLSNQQPTDNVTFEIQPHLIYKHNSRLTLPESVLLEDLEVEGGLFADTDIAYMYQENIINFWNIKLPQQSLVKQTLQTGNITAVQQVFDPRLNKYYLLIVTGQQIHTYEVKIQAYSGKFILEHHKDQQQLENVGTQIYQSKSTDRIFIGGERCQVTELSLSGLSSERPNGSKHNACTNLLSTLFSSQPTKLKRMSKSLSESLINKIISPFSRCAASDPSTKSIKQFSEHERSNTLFVLITDSKIKLNSYIEVYLLGHSGEDFKLQFKISMTQVYEQIEKELEIKIDQGFKNQVEVFDITVVQDSLWVTMDNGLLIEIGLTFTQGNDDESDITTQSISAQQTQTIKLAHSTTIKNVITLPLHKLTERYEALFDDYIISGGDSDSQKHWKPLVSDTLQLTQKNNFHPNQTAKVLDHKQLNNQSYYLIQTTTKEFNEEEKQDYELVHHYVITMGSNFRVPATIRQNQQLVSISKVQCQQAFQLSLQLIKDSVVQVRILTTEGIQTLVVPTQKDVICQYLKLIVTYEQQSQQQSLLHGQSSILDYIQQDFEAYIQSQDLNVTLQALLGIILANPHTETFINSNLNDYYYLNKAKLFASDQEFMLGQVNPQQVQRINLQRLVQSLANYVHNETYSMTEPITLDMQSLAIEVYLTVTDSTKDHQFVYHQTVKDASLVDLRKSQTVVEYSRVGSNKIRLMRQQNQLQQMQQKQQSVRLSEKLLINQVEKEDDGVLEFKRLQSIYLFILNTMKGVMDQSVFRLSGSLNNPFIDSNITPDQLQRILDKLEHLQLFISHQREKLLTIEELDHDHLLQPLSAITATQPDQSFYSTLKQDLSHCQRLLHRLIDGFQTLRNLLKWTNLPQTLKMLFNVKESQDLVKIKVLDFVTQGIAIPQVGALLEQFVANTIDIQSLMTATLLNQEIQKLASQFLSETTLNLIIGKKFLNEAQLVMNRLGSKQKQVGQFQPEDRYQLQQLGFMLFLKSARYVNLSAALTELVKNQMYVQTITLCVKRIDEIDILQDYFNKLQQSTSQQQSQSETPYDQDSSLALITTTPDLDQTFTLNSLHSIIHSLECDKREALIVVCEMIEEVVKRIKQLDSGKSDDLLNVKDKQSKKSKKDDEEKDLEVVVEEKSKFEGINIMQQQLKRERNSENLKIFKSVMFEACLKCKSPLFHQELYHFLLRIQQLSDLMLFKTPYAQAFLSQINDSFDLTSKEYQQLTMKQQADILQQKLETTYLHLRKTHQYAEAFKTIMDHICNEQSVLQIKDRVSWMQRAEGCYLQDQEQHQAYLTTQRQQSQSLITKQTQHPHHDIITDRQLRQFRTYKDYFLIVMQLRDTLQTKLQRSRKLSEQDRQQLGQVIEELSFKVPETNELYQIALQMKQWVEYLKIVKVTEVQQQGLISEQDTQKRIDFMYEQLLDSKYNIDRLVLNRKFEKFLSTLDQLQQVSRLQSEITERSQAVELFPSALIIQHVEQVNKEWMKQNQDYGFLDIVTGDTQILNNSQWHPFWHIDYFFDNHFQALFNVLLQMTRLQPHQPSFNQLLSLKKIEVHEDLSDQPEDYLSFAYLIIRWHRSISGGSTFTSQDQLASALIICKERFRSYKPEMMRLKQQLAQATMNELLYSKEYYQGLVKITHKIDELINL